MKNISRIIAGATLAMAAVFSLAGCTEKEDTVAKAVMASSTYLEFAAQNASAQTLTIYADATWTVDAPDWITVSQTTGTGTVEGVTLSASDNMDGGVMGSPRRDTVKFHGDKLISYSYVIVYQAGDKYRTAKQVTISELGSVSNGNYVVVPDAQVAALDNGGFILTDGTTHSYIPSRQEVKVGDKVSLKGEKTTIDGRPTVTDIEDFTVKSNEAVNYPVPTDITGSLDAQGAVSSPLFVSVSGVFDGSTVSVEGMSKSVTVTGGADLGLADLAGHKVELAGYLLSVSATKLNVVAATVKDNGLDIVIYFTDDFEWIEPWSTASKAGDAVRDNDPSSTAPNVFSTAALSSFVEEFQNRGYAYLFGPVDGGWKTGTPTGDFRTLYLQSNYLKFGKTSYNSGIILPPFTDISGTADVELSFDWCWQVTAAFKPDLMTLTVEIDGDGTCDNSGGKESLNIESAQSTVDGESKIEWQHVTLRLNGLSSTSRVIIRPTEADPAVSNPARKQTRWYLDNIKVVAASGEGGGPSVDPGVEVPDVTKASWLWDTDHFDTYGPTFGGSNKSDSGYLGDNDNAAGDGGKYIDAEEGPGHIYYVNTDKSGIDKDSKCTRNVGGTGEPYIVGAWTDDFWLITLDCVGAYPVGSTVALSCKLRASGTGLKYWIAEIYDGGKWVSATETKTVSISGTDVVYSHELMNTAELPVEISYKTTAPMSKVQVRLRAVAVVRADGNGAVAAPNGGTIRLKGAEASPVISITK